MRTIAENLQIIKDATTDIKQAIIDKGGSISGNISTYGESIRNLNTENSDVNYPIIGDGRTYLHIVIDEDSVTDVSVCFQQSISYGVNINWGDETAITNFSETGNITATHSYNNSGSYTIVLESLTGNTLNLGINSANCSIMGQDSYPPFINIYTSLRSIEVGENVSSITNYAFRKCYNLLNVYIANGVTSIGLGAFYYCYSLLNITIPESVTQIMHNVFQECTSLRRIDIPKEVTIINSNIFYNCSAIKTIILPENITQIGARSFLGCRALLDIEIPSTVSSIGQEAFYYCYALKNISLPDNITVIESYAFSSCYTLSNIKLPNNLTSIGNYAFSNCTSLSKVVFPKSVTSIGSQAFYSCSSLIYLDFSQHESIPTLASNALLYASSTCKIIIPDNLYDSWIAATNWSSFTNQIVKVSDYNAL